MSIAQSSTSKVSIIMSVYNGEKYLRESIESILSQNFSDFTFIIVDDASTDRTPTILKEYAARDIRIQLLTNEHNKGLTVSLNKAIRASHSEYIARMDADDIALPGRLSKQVVFLDDHREYGLVGGWATIIDGAGREVGTFVRKTSDGDIRRNLIKYNCFIHPLVMLRRSVLGQSGLYDESLRYAQDYDLFFRIAEHSKVHNIPEVLLKYRVFSGSVTGSKNRAQAWCAVRARWNAIRSGMYSAFCLVYLLRPLVGMMVPLWLKRVIKKSAL